MINTIFYYPDSLTFEEYQSRLNNNDIAARTIVFADAQKAIYKGGRQFGSTSLSDLKTQIEQIFNENPYTLPIATASRLGGIMIGEGFHIDANTGKLNVDFSGITNGTNGTNGHNGMDGLIKTIFDSVTNIRASKNDYGIVKVGNGINVDNGVISVSVSDIANAVVPNISAAATISNTTGTPTVTVVKTGTDAAPTFTFNFTGLKGEKGDTGATGATGPQGPAGTGSGGTTVTYDDRELRALIAALDSLLDGLSDTADAEKDRLDGVIAGLDQEIEDKIDSLIDDSTWLDTNIISKVQSQSNFGDDDVNQYLQQIGLYTVDGSGNRTWQWSTIEQDVNGLKTSVAALLSGVGESDLTAIQSSLEQYINTQIGTATNNLSTTYARKSAEDVIEWMYSALKQSSSANMTYNQIVSAGNNGLSSAISEVRTYVEKLKSGDYVATSSIESAVDSAIAGLKNSASSNNAKTEIFNKINQNSNDISGIVTSITGDSGSAAIGTKISNWKAGLITTANASTKAAEAGLAVASDVSAAGIVAKVNAAGSSVKINADKIKIDGQHQLSLSAANTNLDTSILNLISNSITIDSNNISIDASQLLIGGYGVNADWYNGGLVNFYSNYGLSATASNTYSWDEPQANNINITNNSILLGSISGSRFDADGMIASRLMFAGDISAGHIFANGLEGKSLSINGPTEEYNYAISLGGSAYDTEPAAKAKTIMLCNELDYYINANESSLLNLTVDKLAIRDDRHFGSGELAYDNSLDTIKCSCNLSANGDGEITGNLEVGGSLTVDSGANMLGNLQFLESSDSNDAAIIGITTLANSLNGFAIDGLAYNVWIRSNGGLYTDLSYLSLLSDDTCKVGINDNQTYMLFDGSGGAITSSVAITTSSDERLKTIHNTLSPSISDIASTRIVDFTYNSDKKNIHRAGTIAQDWLNIVPLAVALNADGYYSLDYSAVATVASVTAAREIVKLQSENTVLKERVEALEARLQLIESKLNA